MGANQFSETALGRDVATAYRDATERAAYEYGHDPYSGTIAANGGYQVFALPPRWKAADFERAMWAYEMGGLEHLKGMDTDWARKERALLKRLQRDVPDRTLRQMAEILSDKWGPCVAVELTGKAATEAKARARRAGTRDRVFLFFGLAPS